MNRSTPRRVAQHMTKDRKTKAGSRLNPVIHPVLLGLVLLALFLTWLLVLR